ncbi:unnamed protein product [Effrenium voratum]|nr:unnamed protein product [Effrenium voratum]
MRLARLCVLCLNTCIAELCFSDGIPPERRSDVWVDDQLVPLRTWRLDWDSALITSQIFEILAAERLGYNVAEPGKGSSSTDVIYMLAGCLERAADLDTCRDQPRRYHISFESWQGQAEHVPQLLSELGDLAPENLGSVGYTGNSGLFVLGDAVDAALQDSGLSLRYYSNYNADWFHPEKYTAKVSDVNMSRLQTCDEAVNTHYDYVGEQYLNVTGDAGGVKTVNGTLLLQCWQEKWWLAPACRSDPERCVPVITGGNGWGIFLLVQQAFWHNLPLALATASSTEEYVVLGKELQSMVYWWTPDVRFATAKAAPVIFPPHNPAEHLAYIYKTARQSITLTKWAAAGMARSAYRAYQLAASISISEQEISEMMESYVMSAEPSIWRTACDYLQRTSRWRAWLPSNTKCREGMGLVDAQNQVVTILSQAVDCGLCPVGRFASPVNQTRICLPCPAGWHQSLPGESQCVPCEPGTITDQAGLMECLPCSLGKYADARGMSECRQCGPGDTAQVAVWTTSKLVPDSPGSTSGGTSLWIQMQAATSESLCVCVPGTFLQQGKCEVCLEGSVCFGSQMVLQEGYYSSELAPGSVYRCQSAQVCPGGAPGTCAAGRDATSVACALCLPGKVNSRNDGSCVQCAEGDYIILTVFGALTVGAITVLYFVFQHDGLKVKQGSSLMIVALALNQLFVTCQLFSIVQQIGINWGEPIASWLAITEILTFKLDYISIGCVTPTHPVAQFATQTFFMLALCGVALLVHITVQIFLGWNRGLKQCWRWSLLARTLGTLCMIFFISVCSSLLTPFRCNTHPNGLSTLQAYFSVFCNGQDAHLHMSLIGGTAFLLPISFLAACTWAVVFELPSRLKHGDMAFVRSCSFLLVRFRPGAEGFAVLFMLRNMLLAILPLVPWVSNRVLLMNLLTCTSLAATAFFKPWRAMLCNSLEIMIGTALIVVMTVGSNFVEDYDKTAMVVVCALLVSFMLLAIGVVVAVGVARHFLSAQRKTYHFFLCHHKRGAGSVARLLKILLLRRSQAFTSFVDCDDLQDLTKLFWHVSQNTRTFLILGSPEVIRRPWCLGEMVTARVSEVSSILIAWPNYVKPDQEYISECGVLVQDINELAKFGIGLSDVQDTLRWLNGLQSLSMPALVTCDTMESLVDSFTGTSGRPSVSARPAVEYECCLVADLNNMEAAAAAHILLDLLMKQFLRGMQSLPKVLMRGETIREEVETALMICSAGCFKSTDVAAWILEICTLPACPILPVIAEESFQVPSDMLYQELYANPPLREQDVKMYVKAIKVMFKEIAISFSTYAATQAELDLHAHQIMVRLRSNSMRSISKKMSVMVPHSMSGEFKECEESMGYAAALRPEKDKKDDGPVHCLWQDADLAPLSFDHLEEEDVDASLALYSKELHSELTSERF